MSAGEQKFVPQNVEPAYLPAVNQPGKEDAREEILINYRPFASTEKWLKYRFSAWSTAKAWFAMTLVVLFFGFGGPGLIFHAIIKLTVGALGTGTLAAGAASAASSQLLLQFLFTFLAVVGGSTATFYLLQPTHVRLTRKGIALEWNHFESNWHGPKLPFMHGGAIQLPWTNVQQIELCWPKNKTSPQDCVIKFKGLPISGSRSQYPIKLKLGAIATLEERNKLLKAIEDWSGEAARDPQLLEMLAPAHDHSYTELWLQALSAPPKRERLTPLHEGALLQDQKYEVLRQLGVGGQGTAYMAVIRGTDHRVVLKEFILPVYVDVNVRRQALDKMQHEAAILRRLDNDRVVKLIEFFVEDHRGYLVLECIDGPSLRMHVAQNGYLPEPQVRELASQMSEILTYLHSLEPPVVHRDFTPDNLILGRDGILKLVDFNVAQQTESTATGTVVGKHAYISPEQFRGRPTIQSDIYAMGATLYFLLTGNDPEPITSSHPITHCPDLSKELDQLIATATALDAKKRYQNIGALKADLAQSTG